MYKYNRNIIQKIFGLGDIASDINNGIFTWLDVDCQTLPELWNNIIPPITNSSAGSVLYEWLEQEIAKMTLPPGKCIEPLKVGELRYYCGNKFAFKVLESKYTPGNPTARYELRLLFAQVGAKESFEAYFVLDIDITKCAFLRRGGGDGVCHCYGEKPLDTGEVITTPVDTTPAKTGCPCDCKEVSIQKTIYFSRTAAGGNSKAVRVPVKKTVCNTTPGKASYQWNCADDLARLVAALNQRPIL